METYKFLFLYASELVALLEIIYLVSMLSLYQAIKMLTYTRHEVL